MDTIYADFSVSMTDFKRNPAEVVRRAGQKPVAVLNHNKPAFYTLTPKLFEAILEELEDKELVELTRKRLTTKGDVVVVGVDKI
jgi:antitoxin StbD